MALPDNLFFDPKELAHTGVNVIIGKTVRLRKPALVSVGDYSILDDFTYVSCALTIGRFTHVGANSVIIGGRAHVRIGSFVNIAPGCRLIAASNDFVAGGLVGPAIPPEYADESVVSDIHLGDHVLLGTNTVILPGVQMPEGVSTGAMTLISPKMKLEPWTLYVGAPACAFRKRDSALILSQARALMSNLQYNPK
jgi:acetyltransferase-like isoleucine patch superfamily enzyme